MIAGLVVLALLLLVLLVTVIGLVLEVISLRTILRSLDHDSVGEVKGSVRRLESNMNNSTKYYLTKLKQNVGGGKCKRANCCQKKSVVV